MRSSDLTARARIRDAAIRRFGREGFRAGLRAIAADADVSPALIVTHFGSKDGLRQACDDHVLEIIRDTKEGVVTGGPDALLQQIAAIDGYGDVVGYVAVALIDDGSAGDHFYDILVADAHRYMADGVASGMIRPSVDEEARTRLLSDMSLGALLLRMRRARAADLNLDLGAFLTSYQRDILIPALELYSHGLFADSTIFDSVVQSQQSGDTHE